MEEKVEVEVDRKYLDWPLHEPLDNHQKIIQMIHPRTNPREKFQVLLNVNDVNIDKAGQYPASIMLFNMKNEEIGKVKITFNVQRMRSNQEKSKKPQKNNKDKKKMPKKAKWIIGILIVIIAICLALLYTGHKRNQQQALENARQSRQIKDNAEKIKNQADANKQLLQEVAGLKGAIDKYKKDGDKAALQNELNNLANQNSQLAQQGIGDQAKINDLTNALQAIAQNPDNASQIIQQLEQKDGYNSLVNRVQSAVQGLLP